MLSEKSKLKPLYSLPLSLSPLLSPPPPRSLHTTLSPSTQGPPPNVRRFRDLRPSDVCSSGAKSAVLLAERARKKPSPQATSNCSKKRSDSRQGTAACLLFSMSRVGLAFCGEFSRCQAFCRLTPRVDAERALEANLEPRTDTAFFQRPRGEAKTQDEGERALEDERNELEDKTRFN